jgi:hypothetical protein
MRYACLAITFQLAAAPPGLAGHPGRIPMPAPLSIQVIAPLPFGGLLVQPGGGRITLTPRGSLVPEGPGVVPGASPPAGYARIRLAGPANGQYQLRLSPATPVLRGSGRGAVQLESFHPGPDHLSGRFDAGGAAEIDLGGTLDIPAGFAAGLFTALADLRLDCAGWATAVQTLAISCTLRAPLRLTLTGPLDFGGLMPGDGRGDFHVGPGGPSQGGAAGPTLVKGTPRCASLLLTGPARTCYSILLPQEAFLMGPGGRLRMHGFGSDRPKSGLLPGGGLVFQVGADLDVPALQPTGTYRGTFQVTVAYF